MWRKTKICNDLGNRVLVNKLLVVSVMRRDEHRRPPLPRGDGVRVAPGLIQQEGHHTEQGEEINEPLSSVY